MPKAKPFSGPVDEQLARQLLNSTGEHRTVDGEEVLLGDALLRAAHQLEEIVNRSNELLEGNDFARIVAEHLANKLNRRGNAEIGVTESGQVELYISYEEHPARRAQPARKHPVPLLEELKARAEEMGVDISEFGIKRSKILAYLDGIENGDDTSKKAAKPKKRKAPKKIVQMAEESADTDPGPMSAGPDETRVSPAPDDLKLPKKKPTIVKSDEDSGPVVRSAEATEAEKPIPKKPPNSAKSQGEEGRPPNMRQLVKDSKEVDIGDLLASDPPK